jgi:hypothetical protein
LPRFLQRALQEHAINVRRVGQPGKEALDGVELQQLIDGNTLAPIVRDSAMVEDESDGVTFDAASIVAEDIAKDDPGRAKSIISAPI